MRSRNRLAWEFLASDFVQILFQKTKLMRVIYDVGKGALSNYLKVNEKTEQYRYCT